MTTDIFTTFRSTADPERAAAMGSYMRDQFAFLGIPAPARRKLSRPFLKSMGKTAVDWDFVFTCWRQPEREFQYLAVDYLRQVLPLLTDVDIPRLRQIAVQKSWWDTIDGIDRIAGDIALRFPEVNDTLLQWSRDDNFWLRRIAINHQLLRKEKTDTVLLEQILKNNFRQTEFFINKAIGWSLRDYSKTDPDWVRDFIERHRGEMSPLSLREASKYI